MTDWTIIFGNKSILPNALLFGLAVIVLLAKFVVNYYESKKNVKFLDIIVDLKENKHKYEMSQKHIRKVTFMSWLIYYGHIRIIGSISLLFATFVVISTTIWTYILVLLDYGNVIAMLLWAIAFIIAMNEVIIIVLYGAFFFYLPITVLNYKFDELINKLRISIRWNITNAIHRIFESYSQLISDCKQLSGPYNMFIGLVYCFCPYVIAIFFEMIKIDRNDLLFIFLKSSFLFLLIITILNTFIMNQLSASITVRNKSIHKYLYPMFSSKRIIRIRTKLTIDSFIARLNTQFIGFYCFNLCKFTKKLFYEYEFIISTCYILINNLTNT